MALRLAALAWTSLGIATAVLACHSDHVASTARDAGTDGGFACTPVPSSTSACPSAPSSDDRRGDRDACKFASGATVADSLGVSAEARARIPITHLIVVMQENRSFDHYFGRLSKSGQPDAEGWPDSFSNLDTAGATLSPFHLTSTCLQNDLPHGFAPMHAQSNGGKLDGFITSAAVSGHDGHDALGYYDETDLPFYYWLAKTYAIGDRHFSSVLGPTWPNRDYLYAATSNGVHETRDVMTGTRTIFDALDEAHVRWGVYTDGKPRQDALGWDFGHAGVARFSALTEALADGSLPEVAFVDPGATQDEHPPNDVQKGEAWARTLYTAAVTSPLWPKLAVIYTYDESGGLFDHVPPPKACLASPQETDFDTLGFRVPLTIISPWARPHFVSHAVHDHTSITRLIELLHDMPALTGRDANADALLDLFDFDCPMACPPAPPEAGAGGCPP
jgi:phospholipase C